MQIPFEKIYAADLIHPAEEAAERDCQRNSLYDWFAGEISSLTDRTNERAEAMLQLYPVTRSTAPHLNELYEAVLKRLDCAERYPLFLKWDYEIRAKVSGSEADGHIITLSGASLDELDDDELTALLGQAVGKIKARHAQNLRLIEFLRTGIRNLPLVGAFAEKKFWNGFADWIIAAQFTTDRFALQACGSERAVASLLLKQNGATLTDLDAVINQHVPKLAERGIYFVWLANSLTHFGAIERIQELRRWIRSEKFRRDYPGFYYRLRLESGDCDNSRETELHRAVCENNSAAMLELAQLYIRGNENLPRSFFMATELSKAASFRGNSQACYLFAKCLEAGGNFEANVVNRLYSAAASRGCEAAYKKFNEAPVPPKNIFVEKICDEFAAAYGNRTPCKVDFSESDAQAARDAFWMDADEKIFALETLTDADGGLFGVAITVNGIFGRVSEKVLPFFISWHRLRRGEVQSKNNFLLCDDEKICRVGSDLRGRASELIVRAAHKLRSGAPEK